LEELLEMNRKERERLKAIIRLEEGTLSQKVAAEKLSLGLRQLQRLISDYRKNGEKAIISKHRVKKSNNSLSDGLKKDIITTINNKYWDFGPTFAHEKLIEDHGVKVSVSSIRKIMVENNIWISKKVKAKKVHQIRAPRERYGELIQMDSSYHDWFEGRAPECCLIVLIDDATSKIMWLQFVKWESCLLIFVHLIGDSKKVGF